MKNKLFWIIFSAASIIHVVLTAAAAALGSNNDMKSWFDVSNFVVQGKSIYANTMWYNYGPVWGYTLGALNSVTRTLVTFNFESMHIATALFLGIVDIVIGVLLYRMFGKVPALLYVLNPAAMVLSGFHSQFDNYAIMWALIGWWFFLQSQSRKTTRAYILAALFLGLSLATKQILYLFPLWIFFLPDRQKRPFQYKIMFAGIMYGVFAIGFLIEILRNYPIAAQTLNGIKLFVFGYKGSLGKSALISVADAFMPTAYVASHFNSMPLFKGYIFIYTCILAISGWIVRVFIKDIKYALPLYLLFFFAFSPSLADQYIAIAFVPAAIFYRHWEVIAFYCFTIIYLYTGYSANISNFFTTRFDFGFGSRSLPIFPWHSAVKFIDIYSQAWMLLFSVRILVSRSIGSITSHHKTEQEWRTKFLVFFFIFTTVSLGFFLYVKNLERPQRTIQITFAEYGKNCSVNNDSFESEIRKQCDGKIKCLFPVTVGDDSLTCKHITTVEWRCGPVPYIHPVYFLTIDGESKGSNLDIYCTKLWH